MPGAHFPLSAYISMIADGKGCSSRHVMAHALLHGREEFCTTLFEEVQASKRNAAAKQFSTDVRLLGKSGSLVQMLHRTHHSEAL